MTGRNACGGGAQPQQVVVRADWPEVRSRAPPPAGRAPPSLQAEPPDPAGRAAAQTREQGRRRWCPRLAGGHVEAGGQVLRGGLTPAANEA